MPDGVNHRSDLFSKSIRAGKRTYFFDVKSTKGNDLYMTITESKRRFDDNGNPQFEKHKLFLYREDFNKFLDGLHETMERIDAIVDSDQYDDNFETSEDHSEANYTENGTEKHHEEDPKKEYTNIDFDDLGD
jgi:hypothetical protein